MLALYIIIGIIIFINVLLIFPVTLDVRWKNGCTLTVKYLFLRFKINTEKKEEKPKIKPKKTEKTAQKPKKPKKKRKKISDIIAEYKDILFKFAKYGKKLLKRVVIKKLDLEIIVAEEDSADTAIEYGVVCAGVYPILSAVENIFTLKQKNIDIKTDFENSGSKIQLFLSVGLRPLFAVSTAVGLIITYIKFINNK